MFGIEIEIEIFENIINIVHVYIYHEVVVAHQIKVT